MSPKHVTLEQLGLAKAKPLSKREYQRDFRKKKSSVTKSLDEFKDAEKIIQAIATQGIGSFEVVDLLNTEDAKARLPKGAKMKSLLAGFAQAVRELIREHGVSKKVHIEQRENRLFLVSDE